MSLFRSLMYALCAVFFLTQTVCAQQGTLRFEYWNCASEESLSYGHGAELFFKEHRVMRSFEEVSVDGRLFFEMAQLEPGNYRLEVRTMFAGSGTREIKVVAGEVASIKICNDELINAADYPTAISALKVGEMMSLEYENSGCFHYEKRRIDFKRFEDGQVYFRRWQATGFSWVDKESKKASEVAPDWQLLPSEPALSLWEAQLRNIGESLGCTTSVNYRLTTMDGKVLDIRDAGCNWNGIYRLRVLLGVSTTED